MPNDSVPEIITVNSEQLQRTVRDLLPSQAGFGSELQASNVITPVIDLTPTAEGSVLRVDLQTAADFTMSSAVVTATTTALTTTPGFFKVYASVQNTSTSTARSAQLNLDDGVSTITVYQVGILPETNFLLDIPVILVKPGTTLNFQSGTDCVARVTYRQIATLDGTLVNPNGFEPA